MVQKQLIQQCREGNRKAQRALYDQLSSALFGCCLKYAANYEEAQDVLQDSFITIFQKIGQFDHKGSFEGWCKRIAINTALQTYRRKKTYALEAEPQEADDSMDIEEPDGLAMQDLLEMIHRLPDQYRLVFSLYILDRYSHKEIAALLDITPGTSKSNLSRARKNLQLMIAEWRKQNSSNAS